MSNTSPRSSLLRILVAAAAITLTALAAAPVGAAARAAAPTGVWIGPGDDPGESLFAAIAPRSEGEQAVWLIEEISDACSGGIRIWEGQAYMEGDELIGDGGSYCADTGAFLGGGVSTLLVRVGDAGWWSPDEPEYGPFTRYCSGEEGDGVPTITGTSGDDRLVGTPGNDVIDGEGGDDRLFGKGGIDVLCGSDGEDLLKGGADLDILIGGEGADVIAGGGDWDFASGGGGDDKLKGGAGDDFLVGGAGDDIINGGKGEDGAFGEAGTDTCVAENQGTCEG